MLIVRPSAFMLMIVMIMIGIGLVTPWIEYFFEKYSLNPLRYMDRYFDWCDKIQAQWKDK